MKIFRVAILIASVGLIVSLAMIAPAGAAEIKILTARAGWTVLTKIGPDFERATGHKLNVISGYGPNFAQRINAGEPFDVWITAPAILESAIKNGKIAAGSRTNLMKSGMGVEVRAGAHKPDINSADAFKRALLSAKSIGYIKPNRVHELIERLGLTEDIKSKVVTPDTDIVSEMVAKGELELGIVVTTQILTTTGVDFVGPLPPEIQYFFEFVGAISANSTSSAAARELLDFLRGPIAIPVIKEQGMEPT